VLPPHEKALKHFSLDAEYPTLLVLGGGSGALSLNGLVAAALPELTRYMNVLHLTGKGKIPAVAKGQLRYKAVEFLDDMSMAYSAADLVLCRAGLSTITELSALKKAVLLVPLPGSHQEANALYLSGHQAVISVEQTMLTPENLVTFLRGFLFEHRLQQSLGKQLHELMPPHADDRLARIILENI
jgi:UDP-N-acetylglucosamine--N-acetylmuramyl-(pentapeptide) pyrophosphoryl-undecaprenol N-acetylglucosamine transferase